MKVGLFRLNVIVPNFSTFSNLQIEIIFNKSKFINIFVHPTTGQQLSLFIDFNNQIFLTTKYFYPNIFSRFLGSEDRDKFFTRAQRSRMVYEILSATTFGREKKGEVGLVLIELRNKKAFLVCQSWSLDGYV